MNTSLKKGADVAVKQCLNIKKGQDVLIITDEKSKDIAKALESASEKISANPHLFFLPKEDRPLKKVPENLKSLIDLIKGRTDKAAAFTVFQTNPEEIGGDETPFRVELILKNLLADPNPFRVGHMPGFKKKYLSVLSEPLTDMHKRAEPLMKTLNWADYAHITSKKGTDLKLKIKGRKAIESIGRVEQGDFKNVPSGEVFICPIETYGSGKFIIDGSTGFGVIKKPIVLTFKKGKIVDIKGNSSKVCKNYIDSLETDKWAKIIGELGIGINSKADIVDEMAIAEKAFKTCHIATGKNNEYDGKNESKTHQDVICKNPTIVVSKEDEEKTILKDGKIVV
ncbi:MAG: aminopeptidase [Candidatus Undinarchaeales archaeon]